VGGVTLATLLLAVAGPPLLVVVSRRAFGASPGLAIEFCLHLLFCAIAVAVVLVVLHVERRPLSSIGLRRPDWRTVVFGLLLGLGTVWVLPWVTSWVLPWLTRPFFDSLHDPRVDSEVRELSLLPVWFRVFIGATSGFVEETLYRGYAVERLATLTSRRWLGALLAVIAFALAHVPMWGWGFALTADLPFGIVMTLSYLWRRDLLANGLAHSTGLVITLSAIAA
jgi:membrane protease YdiL (CAAX protease family)